MSRAPQLLPVEQWRLTDAQVRCLDVLCETGCLKSTASRLDRSVSSLNEMLRRIRGRITVSGHVPVLVIVLAWDRARRSRA